MPTRKHLPTSLPFDRVLADVPCSGTGTLARNPEIKWRLTPDDLAELQIRQCAILRSALAQTAPGGRLVYSTCSLEKEENEDVIHRVLEEEEQGSFRVVDCSLELERLRTGGELIWRVEASLDARSVPSHDPGPASLRRLLRRNPRKNLKEPFRGSSVTIRENPWRSSALSALQN